jgi:TPR repeat protein
LAETFDPRFLTTIKQEAQADRARAAFWYLVARELGDQSANELLNRLEGSNTTSSGPALGNPPAYDPAPPGAAKPQEVDARPAIKNDEQLASAVAASDRSAPIESRPVLSERAPPIPAAESMPPRHPAFPIVDLATLLAQGDRLLGTGDITSARLFYERGAKAGDGTAAWRLGETFDPKFLARARLGFVLGDAVRAEHWYSVARELRNAEVGALPGSGNVK